ncbi:MAG: AsmA family protein [Verrucomicrobiota bacterium]
MSKAKKALTGIGITLAVLLIALTVLRIMLPGIIVNQTAKQIPNKLNAQGSLGGIALALLKGSATLNDFTLDQPEGFGDEPLFHADSLHVAVRVRSLMGETLRVKTIQLDGATINLVRNKDGIMNVQSLARDSAAEAEKTTEPKAILIEELRIGQLHLNFIDHSLGEQGFSLALTNISARIDQLNINRSSEQVADIAITAGILQPGRPAAQLGIFGKTRPIGSGIPDAALSLQLIGLELATLKGITATKPIAGVLGGMALDLHLQARAQASLIDCTVITTMDTGATQDLAVRVDLAHETPVIEYDKSSAIFLAFKMLSSPIMAPLQNIGTAAGQVADTVRDTAKEAVEGAGTTVGKVDKGLLGGLKKLAHGEVIHAVGDVAGTAVKTVEHVGGVVGGIAENLGKGALKTVEAAVGMGGDRDLQEQIDERKRTAFTAAAEWVEQQQLD